MRTNSTRALLFFGRVPGPEAGQPLAPIDEFEEAGDRADKTKQDLVAQIIQELQVHATIEEETSYPAVEAKANKDGKEQLGAG